MLAINFNPLQQSQPFPIHQFLGNLIDRIAFFIGSEKNSMAACAFKDLSLASFRVSNSLKCSEFKPYIKEIFEKLSGTVSGDQKASLHKILSELSVAIEVYPRNPESIKIKFFNALKTLSEDEIIAIENVPVSEDVLFLLEMVNCITLANENLNVNPELSDLHRIAIIAALTKTVQDLLGKREVHLASCFAESIVNEEQRMYQKAAIYQD